MAWLLQTIASAAALACAGYAALAAWNWWSFGRPAPPRDEARDGLLDRFMLDYDVVERHQIRIGAPARIALAAAFEQDLLDVPLVRAIFRAREIAMGAAPDARARPHGLIASTQAIGWGRRARR